MAGLIKASFWYFVIFFVIGEIVFTLLEIRAFYIVWTLLTIIPLVTVTIRRLHDTDKGALWILVWFIPIVGWLLCYIFYWARVTQDLIDMANNRFEQKEIYD